MKESKIRQTAHGNRIKLRRLAIPQKKAIQQCDSKSALTYAWQSNELGPTRHSKKKQFNNINRRLNKVRMANNPTKPTRHSRKKAAPQYLGAASFIVTMCY